MTRFFGKTPEGDSLDLLDLSTNQNVKNINCEIGELLFGIGKESFEVTAFFPQLKFISSTNAQITASLTGVDKFQNDLSNVNQAIKIIDEQISFFKKIKPKREEIENLKKLISDNKLAVVSDTKKIDEIRDEINCLEKEIELQERVLNLEKEKIKLQQNAFNEKIKIEKELNEENNNIANLLLEKEKYLSISHPEEKLDRAKSNVKLCAILTPSLATIVAVLFIILSLTKIMSFVVTFIIISILVVSVILLESFFIPSYKKSKNILETEHKQYLLEKQQEKQKINELEKQVAESQKKVLVLKNKLEEYKDVTNLQNENIEEKTEKLSILKVEYLTNKNKYDNINQCIDNLIEEGDRLQSEYTMKLESLSSVDEKLNILYLTKEGLQQAKENVSSRFIVPINTAFKNIISRFNMENREFVIDTNWNVKENTNFGSKEFQYSSQGLQDIISFCQRLNLIAEIYKKSKPIIILDDTFVNLDDYKLDIAKDIVSELSKIYQVIYICCHSRCCIN